MCQKRFFEIKKEKVNFKVDLKPSSNFMSCLKIRVVFKMRQNPPFLTTSALEHKFKRKILPERRS